MTRPPLKDLIIKEPLWYRIREAVARAVCRVFGHSRKLRRKMYCDLCSRCSHVVAPTEKSTYLEWKP